MASRLGRRVTLVLAGLLLGLVVAGVAVYIYYQAATGYRQLEVVTRGVSLPPGALELEEIEGDSIAQVALHDVLIAGPHGDTIAAAPTVHFRVLLPTLGGDGPLVVTQAVLDHPYLNLVESPDGTFNFSRVMQVSAGGKPVATPQGQGGGFVLRDVRIVGGRARLVTPWKPDSLPTAPGERAAVRLVRSGRRTMQLRTVRNLDARLPLLRFGGSGGWRAQVASLSADLTGPDLRVLALSGSAEQGPDQRIHFALQRFRTPASQLSGEGTLSLGGSRAQYDVRVQAQPLAFRDLQWVMPSLPDSGGVSGSFALASAAGGRIAVRGTNVLATAYGSRVGGHFAAVVGGGAPVEFGSTRLSLEPLRISTIQRLGFGRQYPYDGTVTGTISTAGDSLATSYALDLNLLARVTAGGTTAPVSVVSLRGPVAVGGPESMVRFEGVQLALQPLYLSMLRPLYPAQADRLRGVVHGSVVLRGTPDEIRAEQGDLAYEVGRAPETRITDLALTASLKPELRFDLRFQAEPLALGTLSELFPAFPFRTARFSGPVHISGTTSHLAVDADLAGSSGAIGVHGTVSPGETLAFDLSGDVRSFNVSEMVTANVPLQGPMTGSYHVVGTTADLRFNVALAQDTGSFALHGQVLGLASGSPVFDVAGNVTDFNLGMLIGRPALFPSRMTGPIQLRGGGNAPYEFDVALRGTGGQLNLSGYYAGGATPTYRLVGQVQGLDLQQLPLPVAMPPSSITGSIALQGSGTTLGTMMASLRLDATGSTIAGVPVQALRANVAVRDGVLMVDTLQALFEGNRLSADGAWGLTHPVQATLDFRVVASDLARLASLTTDTPGLQPIVAGSFTAEGSLGGWLKAPTIDADFRGQGLHYDGWAAQHLAFRANAALPVDGQQLSGTLTLSGDNLTLAETTSLDSLRLALRGNGDQLTVRLGAIRDRASDLTLAGLVRLEGRTPRGVLLDSLALHLGGSRWELERRAELRWGGVDGVRIDSLFLRSTGDRPGTIAVNGTIPPTGNAALKVMVRNLDLGMVQHALPNGPPVSGVVDVDALLQGPVTDPQLTMQLRGSGVRYRNVGADSLMLSARYDQRALVGNVTAWTAGQRIATVDATVPMQLQVGGGIPSFALLRSNPLRVRVVADSIPVALLTAPMSQLRDGAGVITAQATIGGTIAQPDLNGWAAIRDGGATIVPLGVRYQRISGRVEMQDQILRVDSLTVWSGGSAVVDGTIRLPELTHPNLYLTAVLNGFHAVDDPTLANLTLSGNVALSGEYPKPVLSGRVVVEGGTIQIPTSTTTLPVDITTADVGEIGADTATFAQAAVGPGPLSEVRIEDLTVAVNGGVWIQSDQARVEIKGEVQVFREGETPRIYGTLQAVRGTYTLTIGPLVRDFDVVGGSVRFFGTPDLNPELDITASHEVRSASGTSATTTLNVLVHVTGTLDNPHVALTSDTRPPLPESELLNYLIFGQPTFQTAVTAGGGNPAQQLLVQQLLVQEVLGGLLVQELGRSTSVCEYLQLRGRPDLRQLSNPFSQTSVECGREILPNLFATLEAQVASLTTGGTPKFGLSLDWQVNNHVEARFAREPVRTATQLLFGTVEVPYQWSTEVRGTWEFAPPKAQPPVAPETGQPQMPGEVAPTPLPPTSP
ncbi:MAG TPA: translocation/assembly module TamB domain-containing protein [Longimicrobiaceae bacterium]|nr:translocation/assembly module TamB domain-containing protein [Longimicrobiaceae bacterium]